MKTLAALFRRWLAVSLALAAGVATALAQSRPVSPDRVTFYSEPNFKGNALTVEAGANVNNLAAMAQDGGQAWLHAISSVQVEGSAKAIVYSNANFQGQRLEITRNIADLYGEPRSAGATWDRSIASVSVTGPARTVVVAPAPQIPPMPPPPGPTTVIVVPAGPPPPPPRPVIRISPREAEDMVRSAYREVLSRNADPEGLRIYRDRIMREGWTERNVVQDLQRSAEARSISPEEAITRIYREVLGRDPDPDGMRRYRQLWRDGWTQGQIRDSLRNSAENRDTRARDIITRAYRELLGRDPDPSGYASYERLIRERGYSERQVREALMSSDEYRNRQRGRR